MLTLLVIIAIAVVLFIAAWVATSDREELAEVPPDQADLLLPEGPVTASDVDGLRFGLTIRGYRMSEVDLALDRISEALAERDARIAELEAALAALVEPAVAAAEAELSSSDAYDEAPGRVALAREGRDEVDLAGDEVEPGVDEVVAPEEQPAAGAAEAPEPPDAGAVAEPVPASAMGGQPTTDAAATFDLPGRPPAEAAVPLAEPAVLPAEPAVLPAEPAAEPWAPAEPAVPAATWGTSPEEGAGSAADDAIEQRAGEWAVTEPPEAATSDPWGAQGPVPDEAGVTPTGHDPQDGEDLGFPEVSPAEPASEPDEREQAGEDERGTQPGPA